MPAWHASMPWPGTAWHVGMLAWQVLTGGDGQLLTAWVLTIINFKTVAITVTVTILAAINNIFSGNAQYYDR